MASGQTWPDHDRRDSTGGAEVEAAPRARITLDSADGPGVSDDGIVGTAVT